MGDTWNIDVERWMNASQNDVCCTLSTMRNWRILCALFFGRDHLCHVGSNSQALWYNFFTQCIGKIFMYTVYSNRTPKISTFILQWNCVSVGCVSGKDTQTDSGNRMNNWSRAHNIIGTIIKLWQFTVRLFKCLKWSCLEHSKMDVNCCRCVRINNYGSKTSTMSFVSEFCQSHLVQITWLRKHAQKAQPSILYIKTSNASNCIYFLWI